MGEGVAGDLLALREKFIELQDGGAVLPDGVPGAPALRVGVKETLDLLFRQAEGRPAPAACLPRRRGFIPRPGGLRSHFASFLSVQN